MHLPPLPLDGRGAVQVAILAKPLVILGIIGAPHGVRGELRVKSETSDPLAIGDYGPLTLPSGRKLVPLNARPNGEVVLMRFEGITDRNAAEALKGQTLSVPRDVLPDVDDEDDFYHADLIGLRCETDDGKLVGTLTAIHDFGAGDVLDIRQTDGKSLSLAFTKANVPVVDVAGGRLVVVLPAIVEASPE
jgi:16S rRNA processing protein RimM